MPKTNLGRETEAEKQKRRLTFRRNLIESQLHLRGYRTQRDVETALGLSAGWLSKRLNGRTAMELDDLDKLDKLLKFDAPELARLVRCR